MVLLFFCFESNDAAQSTKTYRGGWSYGCHFSNPSEKWRCRQREHSLVAPNLHACTQRSMSFHACHCITFGSIVLGSGRSSSSNKSDTEFEEKKKCLSLFGAFLREACLVTHVIVLHSGRSCLDRVDRPLPTRVTSVLTTRTKTLDTCHSSSL